MTQLDILLERGDQKVLAHHGLKGQKWGVKNGPPYPLRSEQHSAAEKKQGAKEAPSLKKDYDREGSSAKKSLVARAVAKATSVGTAVRHPIKIAKHNIAKISKDADDILKDAELPDSVKTLTDRAVKKREDERAKAARQEEYDKLREVAEIAAEAEAAANRIQNDAMEKIRMESRSTVDRMIADYTTGDMLKNADSMSNEQIESWLKRNAIINQLRQQQMAEATAEQNIRIKEINDAFERDKRLEEQRLYYKYDKPTNERERMLQQAKIKQAEEDFKRENSGGRKLLKNVAGLAGTAATLGTSTIALIDIYRQFHGEPTLAQLGAAKASNYLKGWMDEKDTEGFNRMQEAIRENAIKNKGYGLDKDGKPIKDNVNGFDVTGYEKDTLKDVGDLIKNISTDNENVKNFMDDFINELENPSSGKKGKKK